MVIHKLAIENVDEMYRWCKLSFLRQKRFDLGRVKVPNLAELVLSVNQKEEFLFSLKHLNQQEAKAVCFFANNSLCSLDHFEVFKSKGHRLGPWKSLIVVPSFNAISYPPHIIRVVPVHSLDLIDSFLKDLLNRELNLADQFLVCELFTIGRKVYFHHLIFIVPNKL